MSDERYKIELFIFPDGTSVELMVFNDTRTRRTPAPAAPKAGALSKPAPPSCCVPPPTREDPDALTCPVCAGQFVYPVDWDRSGPSTWTMILRCPECETRREVTLGRASVERLNRELYTGAQAIAREADQLTRRNFGDEIERIVTALDHDLILPMDF